MPETAARILPATTGWGTLGNGKDGVIVPASRRIGRPQRYGGDYRDQRRHVPPRCWPPRNASTWDCWESRKPTTTAAGWTVGIGIISAGDIFPPSPDWDDPSSAHTGYAFLHGAFGSSHPDIFNAVLCDGSVRSFSYDVDLDVFKCLSSRNDGIPLDANSF